MKTLFFIPLLLMIASCTKSQKAEYSGTDIADKAFIQKDKFTKKTSLKIDSESKWYLYAGTSVDNIDFEKPVAEGSKSGTYPIAVNDSIRNYFQLVTETGKAILSERHLPMTGGYNFRDLGGIETQDGKHVKWGKVFRSDDLHKLTNSDLKYLESIPLVSIVDFRSESEIGAAPDVNPASAHNYQYSISPGNLNFGEVVKSFSPAQMDGAMMDLNRMLVTDSVCINQYRSYFKLLQTEEKTPLMFHCSAGKDRTGMGAALFLLSLGVDEETVLNDYLASNEYLGDKYSPMIAKHPNLKPLFIVKPEFLKAGFEQIRKDHGSIENYLTEVLNVDISKMKKLYLY